jgi:hypothetical protein
MVAGGCIAYFGDRLGYVMGKKRVTLFGLRPRHTAQTLTVVSGLVIGGLALTLLLIVNYTFRFALLNGRQLLKNNRELEQSNGALKLQANANRISAQDAELKAATAEVDVNHATAVLSISEKNLAVTQRKAASVEQQLALKQATLLTLTSQLNADRTQLQTVEASVVRASGQLKETLQKFQLDVETRRSGLLIYRNDAELGRDVISASAAQPQILAELNRFLGKLSKGAGDLGAATGSNHRAVVVATIQLLDKASAINRNSDIFVDEPESLNALASSICSYGHGSVVVIAKALGNSYDGQQVIILLRPYANLLAIPSGTVLGHILISDSSVSADEIVTQLQRFLVTQVRPAAIKDGVIPVRDPQTGSAELGGISLEQVYDVVHRVRDIGGPSVITATAQYDTYSADELKLTFIVNPVPPSAN